MHPTCAQRAFFRLINVSADEADEVCDFIEHLIIFLAKHNQVFYRMKGIVSEKINFKYVQGKKGCMFDKAY